jgi:hypothetical protein
MFHPGIGGLEIQDNRMGHSWVGIPGNEVVLIWRRSGEAFSGGEVKAVNHQVNTIGIATERKTPAIVFIRADHSTELRPLAESQRVPGAMGRGITVNDVLSYEAAMADTGMMRGFSLWICVMSLLEF